MTGAAPERLRHGATLVGAGLASMLLFTVEPLLAKQLLPSFGGGPGVWIAALCYFQILLLGAYLHGAHLARRSGGWQLALHAPPILASLLALPPLLDGAVVAGGGRWTALRLLLSLGRTSALPFFVLAANTSLASAQVARRGGDPYPLYALTNGVALATLLVYPWLIEPWLGLAAQGRLWSVAYGAFALLLLGLLWVERRRPAAPMVSPDEVSPGRKGRWLLRGATASLLLGAVSLRLSTDLAAVPLLWLAPLALYLASFVAAFSRRLPYPRRWLGHLGALLLFAAALPLPWGRAPSLWIELAPPLLVLAVGSWICHGDLYRDRPPGAGAPSLYLWLALGGALGGSLAGLVLPLLVDQLIEYPLALAALALVLELDDGGVRLRAELRRRRLLLLVLALLVAAALLAHRRGSGGGWFAWPFALLLVGLALRRLPGAFAATVAAAGWLGLGASLGGATLVDGARSFHGLSRVVEDGERRLLIHGTTVHGLAPRGALGTPIGYYHPAAPIPEVISLLDPGARLGVVGLGAGAVRGLARPGQSVVFFELDAAVVGLARRHFRFLDRPAQIVLGDARVELEAWGEAPFDLLLMDAFTSDAVPVHLLTVEAQGLYLRRIREGGVALVHVSNRYLDLLPLLRAGAAELGATALVRRFRPDEDQRRQGAMGSLVVALTRAPRWREQLIGRGWSELGPRPAVRWTDDRSSLVELLRPRGAGQSAAPAPAAGPGR